MPVTCQDSLKCSIRLEWLTVWIVVTIVSMFFLYSLRGTKDPPSSMTASLAPKKIMTKWGRCEVTTSVIIERPHLELKPEKPLFSTSTLLDHRWDKDAIHLHIWEVLRMIFKSLSKASDKTLCLSSAFRVLTHHLPDWIHVDWSNHQKQWRASCRWWGLRCPIATQIFLVVSSWEKWLRIPR